MSTTAKPKATKTSSKEDAEGTTKKRKKARQETYSSYIYKGTACHVLPEIHSLTVLHAVLRQVHPDTGISKKAMGVLNSFVNDLFERIATEASSALFFSVSFNFVNDGWMLPDPQNLHLTTRSPPFPRARFKLQYDSFFLESSRNMRLVRERRALRVRVVSILVTHG